MSLFDEDDDGPLVDAPSDADRWVSALETCTPLDATPPALESGSRALTLYEPPGTLAVPDARALHYSDAKWLACSALHYKAHLAAPFEPTRAMRVGTIVHRLVLGGPFPDIVEARRGAAWAAFKAEHPVRAREAVTQQEVDDAAPMADAVLAHPLAREYLAGAEYEVPLSWTIAGRRFRTRGVDILQRGRRHGDLKTCRSVRPEKLRWTIRDMLYHAQVRWVADGLAAEGFTFTEAPFLLCVEGPPAYDVVVVELTPADLEEGGKLIHTWLSRLDQAEQSGEWTGYSQAPIKLELPQALDLEGLEVEADTDEGAA